MADNISMVRDGDEGTSEFHDELSSVQAVFEREAEYRCEDCSIGLVQVTNAYGTDWRDAENEMDADCAVSENGKHHPVRVPLSWGNWARIDLDEAKDSVTVSISVDDPNGAFTLEIYRVPDDAENNAGKLIMFVPNADMAAPHMPLKQINSGAFIIGEA